MHAEGLINAGQACLFTLLGREAGTAVEAATLVIEFPCGRRIELVAARHRRALPGVAAVHAVVPHLDTEGTRGNETRLEATRPRAISGQSRGI
jgi:predicted deacylase